jgi:hypothetical protein
MSIGVVDILDVDVFGDGRLNESYHKTSGLSLGGLVGIGSLYTSTEDLEGRM